MPGAVRDRGALGVSLIAAVVAVLIGGGAAVTTAVVVVRNTNASAAKGVLPSGQAPQPQLPSTKDIVGYGD